MVLGKIFRVLHKTDKDSIYSVLLEHRNDKTQSLLFESGAIAVLSSHESESLRNLYSTVTDSYGVLGILSLAVGDTSHLLYLVLVNSCVSVGKVQNSEIFRVTDTVFLSLRNNPADHEKVQEVKKVLNSGQFFFTYTPNPEHTPFDLTLCAQRRYRTEETDNRFFWNRLFHCHFLRYGVDTNKWLVKAMCGGVTISTVYVGHLQAKACIISRLSTERAGTRFNVRGVNDDGHVANFVETEQCIYMDDKVASYVIIRGSVPLFWEQPGLNVGSHKIKMSRSSEVSQPAYDRHLNWIRRRYGKQMLINLMGSKEGETMLSKMFKAHHKTSKFEKEMKFIYFDYHAQCPRGKQSHLKYLKDDIAKGLKEFGYYYEASGLVLNTQAGTFRVNCVDCLDRTNSVQTFIGLDILSNLLGALSLNEKPQIVSRFDEVYKNMWVQNGDQIAKIYAGTGALEGKSKIKDSTLSVARTIQNNLLDSSKQEAMDILLLGKGLANEYADRARSLLPFHYLLLPPDILISLCDRYLEYTQPKQINIVVGTWNVNGGKHFTSVIYKRSDPLSDWLLDFKANVPNSNIMDLSLNDSLSGLNTKTSPDIFAIGFEEIVDLNASNIMAASTTNQKEWMIELRNTISREHDYVIITSVQLVGVCLFVFVRPNHAPFIRDVAVDQVKTGLHGATGNKGGVAIRMSLHGTSLCFVCAHFAAGQSQVHERNADYAEITRKISFPLGRSLNMHDYVFWCGDFNYRVDMDNDQVKELILNNDLEPLLGCEQLKNQKKEDKVFKNYIEGDINFPPTYKYDINSKDYDTSEKCRVPAWTDRILFKKRLPTRPNEDIKSSYASIKFYGRAELKTSDHRPVVAEFAIDVLKVDENAREKVFKKVLEQMGPPDATIIVRIGENSSELFGTEIVTSVVKFLANKAGEIVLARFGDDHLRVIFRDGRCALDALRLSGEEVNGLKISIELRTPNWIESVQNEMALAKDNTIPLIENDEYYYEDFLNETDIIIGPPVDPHTFFLEDDIDHVGSGRSSPSGISRDGSDGRSTPTKVPMRPPPPKINNTQINANKINDMKPKPIRPAPPPPSLINKSTISSNLSSPPPDIPPPFLSEDEIEEYSSPPMMPPPQLHCIPNNSAEMDEPSSTHSTVTHSVPLLPPVPSRPLSGQVNLSQPPIAPPPLLGEERQQMKQPLGQAPPIPQRSITKVLSGPPPIVPPRNVKN